MKINKKILAIQILAVIGLILSIKLAFIHYSANYDKYALSSFCSINDFIDCDGAAKTIYSQFLGIPLCYWGIFFYITVMFLTLVDCFKKFKFLGFLEVFKAPRAYITFLGSVAFLFSMLLAIISIFVIKKLCILCFVTYLIDLSIALISAEGMFNNIVIDFKSTFIDFIEGVKKYPKTFVALLIIAASFLAYTGITLKFVPNVKQSKSIMKYRKIKYNPYRVKGNQLGNPKGNVVIELYSDYVCPLCYINNIMLHQAVKEYDNVQVIHHNYPFDKECNKYIDINMHPNACFMSKAAYAAKEQGNYWEMSSLLYENQPKNKEELLILVDKLNFDRDKFIKDFESKAANDKLLKEIEDGVALEVDATPTMYVNGEKVIGVKPYYQLKEILENHGGHRK